MRVLGLGFRGRGSREGLFKKTAEAAGLVFWLMFKAIVGCL